VVKRTAAEVVKYLRDFIDGTGAEWDWDDFESVPIDDPALAHIQREARLAAPPNGNIERLRELLAQAEALAAAQAGGGAAK